MEVVDCPNLKEAPYHLASEGTRNKDPLLNILKLNILILGLSGSTSIVDIGGPPFLLPLVDRTKIYDLKTIAQKVQPPSTDILAIGAGAGYYPLLNTNCEVIRRI